MLAGSIIRVRVPSRACRIACLLAVSTGGLHACGGSDSNSRDEAVRAEDPAVAYVRAGDSIDAAARRLAPRNPPWVLQLGPGQHELDAPLLLPSGSVLTGSGPGTTVIVAAREMEQMVANAGGQQGNRAIGIDNLTLDCANRAGWGAKLVRVADLRTTDLEISGCTKDGMRVSGRGEVTRVATVANIYAHHNRGNGLVFMWAVRNVQYQNLAAHHNGGHGIVLDHSEFQATNVAACGNAGYGIHLRNFFASSLGGSYACRNGRHGIFVEGMVASLGDSWVAQSNSRSQPGTYDDVHFSNRSDLSYGVSRNTRISGLAVGSFRAGFGEPTSRRGVHLDEGVTGVTIEGLVSSPP